MEGSIKQHQIYRKLKIGMLRKIMGGRANTEMDVVASDTVTKIDSVVL